MKKFGLKSLISIVSIAVVLTALVVYAATPSPVLYTDDWAFPYKYVIKTDGTNYWAVRDDGKMLYSSTDAAYVIQSSLNALTNGRTAKEWILLTGNIILNVASSLPITVPSETGIRLDGKLTLADNMGKNIFENTNNPCDIKIEGGTIDANGEAGHGNTASIVFHFAGSAGTYDARIFISDMTINKAGGSVCEISYAIETGLTNCIFKNNGYGCYFYYCEDVAVSSCQFATTAHYGIELDTCSRFNIIGNLNNYGSAYFVYLINSGGGPFDGVIADNSGNIWRVDNVMVYVDTTCLNSAQEWKNVIMRNNFMWHSDTGEVAYPIRHKITNPFETTSGTVSPWGDEATPTTKTIYTCWGWDLLISAYSGTITNITAYDVDNNVVLTGATSLYGYYLPIGYRINFTYSDAPTFIVCGV